MFKKMMLAVAVVGMFTGCTRVDTGNIGVEKVRGQVKMEELGANPGYFTLFKEVVEVNGKETSLSMSDLKPKAKENLTMQDFDFDVYYKVNPGFAADLMVKYSGDLTWDEKADAYNVGQALVARQAREAAYNSAAQYAFAEMQNKRSEIASDIEKGLQAELDRTAGKGAFTVTNVVVRNITTDANLERSIREAADVEFQVRKKQQQLELARAEADRLKVEAQGQADANRILSESLTPALVKMKEYETMEKFSQNQNVTILFGANGSNTLLNVK